MIVTSLVSHLQTGSSLRSKGDDAYYWYMNPQLKKPRLLEPLAVPVAFFECQWFVSSAGEKVGFSSHAAK